MFGVHSLKSRNKPNVGIKYYIQQGSIFFSLKKNYSESRVRKKKKDREWTIIKEIEKLKIMLENKWLWNVGEGEGSKSYFAGKYRPLNT